MTPDDLRRIALNGSLQEHQRWTAAFACDPRTGSQHQEGRVPVSTVPGRLNMRRVSSSSPRVSQSPYCGSRRIRMSRSIIPCGVGSRPLRTISTFAEYNASLLASDRS